ncbi:hypothetical protein [Mycobacterium sherrisii]|uniref:hypothetical protein n=1 Tax=Mycobacterium sherrisii TaxID=243061 RepID=UPI0012F4F06C|nr:hypothetical protein [Mycobacterium sherrisii]
MEYASHLVLERLFVIGCSEHLAYVKAVILGELAGRLASSFRIENLLHRIKDIARVFCCRDAGKRPILLNCGDDLGHFGFHGHFGIFYRLDALITFRGNIGQVMLEAHHTVVGVTISVLFDAVLLRHLSRLIFALTVSIAKIVGCVAPLVGEGAGLGMAQRVRKMLESCPDTSPIGSAM